jgi:hypothetical protein
VPIALLAALFADALPYTGAADRIPAYAGTVHWYASGTHGSHWETSRTPSPVSLPPGGGVLRVRNLELPPSGYDVAIDSFFPGYYEWLTPAVYRGYWRTADPGRLAEAGVRLAFRDDRPDPQAVGARPHATLERHGSGEILAFEAERTPGRIRVDATVPAGGGRLVVLEQRFPGWEVRVDGTRGSLHEAAAFLEVDLPEGVRSVAFEYTQRTWPRRAGLVGTAVALGVALAVPLRRRWRKGR